MNLQDFKQWARRKLGDGSCGVRVEVDDRQLEQALDEAKDWFNAFLGIYREGSFSIVDGQSEYDLSSVSPSIDEIVQVWFPRQGWQVDFTVVYPGFLDVSGFPYGNIVMSGLGYPQTTLVQSMQAIESNARVFSADLSWEYIDDRMTSPVTKKLRIMPAPKYSGNAVYFYRVDPSDIKLKHYRQRDLFLLREYALAMVKYTLGRVRGKYASGLPAAGGDKQLDGESLIQEAREDIQRLEEKLMGYHEPVMPVVG